MKQSKRLKEIVEQIQLLMQEQNKILLLEEERSKERKGKFYVKFTETKFDEFDKKMVSCLDMLSAKAENNLWASSLNDEMIKLNYKRILDVLVFGKKCFIDGCMKGILDSKIKENLSVLELIEQDLINEVLTRKTVEHMVENPDLYEDTSDFDEDDDFDDDDEEDFRDMF